MKFETIGLLLFVLAMGAFLFFVAAAPHWPESWHDVARQVHDFIAAAGIQVAAGLVFAVLMMKVM